MYCLGNAGLTDQPPDILCLWAFSDSLWDHSGNQAAHVGHAILPRTDLEDVVDPSAFLPWKITPRKTAPIKPFSRQSLSYEVRGNSKHCHVQNTL
jgi:hypothetical protein